MKLLFDQSLSPRLVGLLADLFAGSLLLRTHAVRIAALQSEGDTRFLVLV